jgi:hypothetical protein
MLSGREETKPGAGTLAGLRGRGCSGDREGAAFAQPLPQSLTLLRRKPLTLLQALPLQAPAHAEPIDDILRDVS